LPAARPKTSGRLGLGIVGHHEPQSSDLLAFKPGLNSTQMICITVIMSILGSMSRCSQARKEPLPMTVSTMPPTPVPVMYKIPEVMTMLRMSRHLVYEQIRRKRLRIVKEGRSTFVTDADLRAYVDLLRQEAQEAEAGQ
jgi:hypothetical protein